MSEINERIVQVLKEKNVKKIRFAEALNISPAYVTDLCAGRKSPSNRTIADICRLYDVNEEWLRTGNGEMFMEKSTEQELMEFFADISSEPDNSARRRLVKALAKLPPEAWDSLVVALEAFANEQKEKPSD